MDPTIFQAVQEKLFAVIKQNEININSPFAVITKGMEIVNSYQQLNGTQKKALLLKTLQEIAAGKDNVAGTSDDILPVRVVKEIEKMLDSGLVDDFVNVVRDVAKGKFEVNKAVDVAVKAVPFCFGLCGRKVA